MSHRGVDRFVVLAGTLGEQVFYTRRMPARRAEPSPSNVHASKVSDEIRIAWIAGVASRHAPWKAPTGDALAEAKAAVQEAATDHTGALRTDLLGYWAGILQGFAESQTDSVMASGYAVKVALLVEAGADPVVMERWLPEGKKRAEPRMPPNSGSRGPGR